MPDKTSDAHTVPPTEPKLERNDISLEGDHVELENPTLQSEDSENLAYIRVKLIGEKTDARKRDSWDKADIVAKLLSSVLLAGVALLINSSIQRSQMASADALSRAQMEAAKIKAQDDKKLQEGALTAQLVQHLASKDPVERQISIIALRESVPQQIYGAAVLILAQSDPSKDVRIRAIENLPASPSISITKSLTTIASDETRPADERKAAEISAQQAAVGQFLTGNSEIVFAAATPNTRAFEGIGNLRHGVFTHFLLKGLSGEADTNSDGIVDSRELQKYLGENVPSFTEGQQRPYMTTTTTEAMALTKSRNPNAKVVVIAIGISGYSDPKIGNLFFPQQDAEAITDLYKSKTSSVTLLTGASATRLSILNLIQRGAQSLRQDDTLIIYYGGRGTLVEGKPMLVPYDAAADKASSLLSVDDLKSSLGNVHAVKVLYLDTCFTPG
jgi:hypothetical protein